MTDKTLEQSWTPQQAIDTLNEYLLAETDDDSGERTVTYGQASTALARLRMVVVALAAVSAERDAQSLEIARLKASFAETLTQCLQEGMGILMGEVNELRAERDALRAEKEAEEKRREEMSLIVRRYINEQKPITTTRK